MNDKIPRIGILLVVAMLFAPFCIAYGSTISRAVHERTDGDEAIALVTWCVI